jgi:hypothetical protein
MGTKAQQGSYSYEEYQSVFNNMSPEEREQFQREARLKLRRLGLIFGGFFVFWIMFSRTPHKAYTEFNGTLIPIEPTSPYTYPDQFAQQPAPYPHGQSNNPYVGLPYQPPGPYPVQSQGYPAPSQPSQQYGSQYPQAQYLAKHNEFTQQQASYGQPQPLGGYGQSQPQYSPMQQKSQYTVERPQNHQPYPNSPYAEKPIQSNYQPGYQTQAPKGMED